MTLLMFLVGLVGLILGADVLVRGSSKLAFSFGISPLVIGLTIVAFGTSAPEVAVSVSSALKGNPDFALGNVIGSNTFNTLVILGLSAIITPLFVHAQIIKQEIPILLAASLLLVIFAFDQVLTPLECGIFFASLLIYTTYLVIQSRGESKEVKEEFEKEAPSKSQWDSHWSVQVLLICLGLFLLVKGSDFLVEAAIIFAKSLGVSDLVIGLTILAAGTSMPEVATSITAAIKGEKDIAVGNVIGSNTFNILGCLGLTGLISGGGIAVAPSAFAVDLWVMIAVGFICLPIALPRNELSRSYGFIFVAYYILYTTYLFLSSTSSAYLGVLTGFVTQIALPLTVFYVLVIFLRHMRTTRPFNKT